MAPGEIRELVARLTEQSVEAVPAHASRTLEGLALETGIPIARLRATLSEIRRKRPRVPPAAWVGFVFLAAVAGWALRPSPPIVLPAEETPVVQPKPAPVPKVTADLSGTVPLTSVTYGPDSGSVMVDPSFQPSVALPEGLSVSASVGEVLWGSGDHRAAVLEKPLTPAQEKAFRADVEELLRYVRKEAARRHLDLAAADHKLPITLSDAMYYGSGSTSLSVPGPGAANDRAAEAAIRQAAQQLLDQIQQQLRQRDRWRRENGP